MGILCLWIRHKCRPYLLFCCNESQLGAKCTPTAHLNILRSAICSAAGILKDKAWYSIQRCKFSGNCLNLGLHEAEIPALLFIFSRFWRLLAQIHALFQAFALRSAYIPGYLSYFHCDVIFMNWHITKASCMYVCLNQVLSSDEIGGKFCLYLCCYWADAFHAAPAENLPQISQRAE